MKLLLFSLLGLLLAVVIDIFKDRDSKSGFFLRCHRFFLRQRPEVNKLSAKVKSDTEEFLEKLAEKELKRQEAIAYVQTMQDEQRILASHCSLCIERAYENKK